jgi:GR25 family glycosyltransferase involved in LPS biosynthesis
MYFTWIIKKIKILIMEENLIEAVYYINMDKSVERRRSMEAVLKDKVFDSMKKYRIPGVDGGRNDILPYLHSQIQNIKITKKYNTKVYGCLLSHLHALLEFSKSNYEIALIVEDDLSLDYKKYWQSKMDNPSWA